MRTPTGYDVRVSACDDCDVRRTYEALWELGEVPTTYADATDAAARLRDMLARDGYTLESKTVIESHHTFHAN